MIHITIIYIEDVCLDNFFNDLMWYMCANIKGYQLSEKDISWCIGLVNHLVKKNIIWPESDNQIQPTITIDDVRNDILNGTLDKYLFPVAYRYEFNGFQGELKLMLNYIENFKSREEYNQFKLLPVSKYIGFGKNDILKVSIDFHCSSIIDYIINKYNNSDWTVDLIKKTIWFNRSSLNYRLKKKNYNTLFYRCIKRDCDNYAETLINEYFT